MATQEFYIREASEAEARGPFNQEQLVSLAETGQLTVDTLWYDPAVEDWAAIGTNDNADGSKELNAIYPGGKRISIQLANSGAGSGGSSPSR